MNRLEKEEHIKSVWQKKLQYIQKRGQDSWDIYNSHYHAWTDIDVIRLIFYYFLYDQVTTSHKLGRTVDSIRTKIHYLNEKYPNLFRAGAFTVWKLNRRTKTFRKFETLTWESYKFEKCNSNQPSSSHIALERVFNK
jgi:hypothetical protein